MSEPEGDDDKCYYCRNRLPIDYVEHGRPPRRYCDNSCYQDALGHWDGRAEDHA